MKHRALLHGIVIRGERIGRTVGYPTANLDHGYFQTNPQPKGVYAARAWVGRTRHSALAVIGVPGTRFPDGKVEVHLLDYSRELYGRTITADLISRIRPLVWYGDLSKLQQRIAADIRIARPSILQFEQEERLKHTSLRMGVRVMARRFSMVRDLLRIGASERTIAEGIRRIFREYQPSFPTIVASGPYGAFMHHVPTRRMLRRGDAVVVDFGIKVNGFCTDLSRTFFIGQPNAEQRRRYEAALRSLARGERAAKPFIMARDVDHSVRGYLGQQRLARWFVHNTGHAVGTKIHQPPTVGPRSVDLLLPGDVVTIEPGIYVPKWGGIRIEDMVQIGVNGAEVLTAAIPTSLRSAIVC